MTEPKVAAVILNWNGWEDTLDLLESFHHVEYSNFMLVVIDNASNDNSEQRIITWIETHSPQQWDIFLRVPADPSSPVFRRKIRKHVFVRLEENVGFCRGNNLGMELGYKNGAAYALIINNDTLVSPTFLKEMVNVSQNQPKAGLVGGIITYCSEPEKIWWGGGIFTPFLGTKRLYDHTNIHSFDHTEPYETEWVSGCMMLIKKEVYEQIGGFYEPFFIWSEEWDYSLRARREGFRCIVVPSARICHKVGKSLGVLKPLSYYYGTRNGLLLRKMYLPRWKWCLFLPFYMVTRMIRYSMLLSQGRTDLVKAGIWAVADALRNRTGKWQRHDSV